MVNGKIGALKNMQPAPMRDQVEGRREMKY
jgi:hypothetical protein